VETCGGTRVSKARRKRGRERKSGREDEWRRGSSTI